MALALLFILVPLFTALIATNDVTGTPENLRITAISASNGASTIECWRLAAPSIVSSQAGVAGAAFAQFGKAGNVSYGIIPAKYDGGLHNGPANQFVAFSSGFAVISVPHSHEKAYIEGGRYGTIFVADTASVSRPGHLTQYPSNRETTALQIPTADGSIPPHIVLHKGPCLWQQISGQGS